MNVNILWQYIINNFPQSFEHFQTYTWMYCNIRMNSCNMHKNSTRTIWIKVMNISQHTHDYFATFTWLFCKIHMIILQHTHEQFAWKSWIKWIRISIFWHHSRYWNEEEHRLGMGITYGCNPGTEPKYIHGRIRRKAHMKALFVTLANQNYKKIYFYWHV